jgi:hypothetical protein
MTKTEEIFATELNFINDKDVKNLVIDCMTRFAADYFWFCPASISGKYHPKISLGKGGLLRHVKLAVWIGKKLARAYDLNTMDTDIVIASLLLHDIIKSGDVLNSDGFAKVPNATAMHGIWLAERLRNEKLIWPEGRLSYPIRAIIQAIAGHMGIWTDDNYSEFKPLNQQEFKQTSIIVHLADYIASRKIPAEMNRIYSEIAGDNNGSETT